MGLFFINLLFCSGYNFKITVNSDVETKQLVLLLAIGWFCSHILPSSPGVSNSWIQTQALWMVHLLIYQRCKTEQIALNKSSLLPKSVLQNTKTINKDN